MIKSIGWFLIGIAIALLLMQVLTYINSPMNNNVNYPFFITGINFCVGLQILIDDYEKAYRSTNHVKTTVSSLISIIRLSMAAHIIFELVLVVVIFQELIVNALDLYTLALFICTATFAFSLRKQYLLYKKYRHAD